MENQSLQAPEPQVDVASTTGNSQVFQDTAARLSQSEVFAPVASAPNTVVKGYPNSRGAAVRADSSLQQPIDQVNLTSGQQQASSDINSSFEYPGVDPFDLFGDGDAIFGNVDFSSLFLPSDFGLGPEIQEERFVAGYNQNQQRHLQLPVNQRFGQSNDSNAEQNSISRFGSPLPSVRPDARASTRNHAARPEHISRPLQGWKISKEDYLKIQNNLSPFLAVLPKDFSLPSRHSMSRYLEGCVKGLLEHMPLLHVPTWHATSAQPDLLLAMAAIGALFRFEGHMAVTLFYAAKATLMYQLQTRKDRQAEEALTQSSRRCTGSSTMSPKLIRDSLSSQDNATNFIHQDRDTRGSRLQTMQAILSLMVLGSWGPKELVTEAIAFQSLVAELAREDGLASDQDGDLEIAQERDGNTAWAEWARAESLRRTKLTAYTFVDLQSVAYNVPPAILTSEMQILLPAPHEEWNAKTSEAWNEVHRASNIAQTTFAEAFRSLFRSNEAGDSTPPLPSSAIGNYALIFALLQCIYYLRQGCSTFFSQQGASNLRSEDVETLSRALQNWQSRWENSPESAIEPQSLSGPVAFNSTALLRLAWIRLHSDLGPCRNLASRNPALIVEAFKSSPPLHRHSGLTPAILHAAHALSVPVRLGIDYVAKTQTLSWSVQHSLCNLECAIFLSKWFEVAASTAAEMPLTSQEKGLVSMIRSIILETGFFNVDAFEPAADDGGWQRLILHLGTAVAALWAEIFSGTHVFDMVSTIGTSLNIYAKLLEDMHTPINGNS